MAERPVFIPKNDGSFLVEKKNIEFQYFSGFAVVQKQKSIDSLHQTITRMTGFNRILEVSSKSRDQLGIDLSAFNLMMEDKKTKKKFSVECAFQSSKVFENGGPFLDLLYGTSKDAKKDPRIKESGQLKKFYFYEREWKLEPLTAFYDWLYINALNANPQLHGQLDQFQAFTDIEFNPEKSINCQAHSIAMFLALKHRGLLDRIKNQDKFLELYKSFSTSGSYKKTDEKYQIGLKF